MLRTRPIIEVRDHSCITLPSHVSSAELKIPFRTTSLTTGRVHLATHLRLTYFVSDRTGLTFQYHISYLSRAMTKPT